LIKWLNRVCLMRRVGEGEEDNSSSRNGCGFALISYFFFGDHLVGVIWIGRWAGERKERITEVTS